jgi:hypothetical protein
MKTIGDLERWLKGAGNGVMIEMRFKKGEFRVFMGGGEVKSKTLEGALENALEELRRKENGAESMRSEKTTSVPLTVTVSRPSITETHVGRRSLYDASAPSAFATYLRNDIRVRRSRLLCQRERLQLPQLPADPEAMTYLTTAEAATYLRYKTAAAVRQLKARGCIQPVGRRGKTDLYDRAALDAFVLGSAVERTGEHTHANESTKGEDTAWLHGSTDGRRRAIQAFG